ncbi:DNA replication/repair protein RecF [Agarivorans albus]|uniref:DNA replication and repair protein RecF n=1 Tax=Agarivorans albus MKT 106 TaxID=1331007 RepID=R9PGJ9_AGAAL|nr:DNA replication/repair protein RecF [Agarivorans albus]GAD00514.1 DNA recombination and repair protein RecF [Agarivorans albus MKT 106]
MQIQSLGLQNFRNIKSANLSPNPKLNVILGQNGSGKTSVLEAIYYLGFGRSFRSNRPSKVITYQQDSFVVFAQLDEHKIGLQKFKGGDTALRINKETVRSQAVLASLLPLQILHPEGYGLVDGSPKHRRAYLDWGVFHVEHQFHAAWQNYKRILKQRNALLKQTRQYQDLQFWDKQLVELAFVVSDQRKKYVESIADTLAELVTEFLPEYQFDMAFYQGWDDKVALEELLKQSFERDRLLGYTQYGPHKADLKFKFDGINAVDVISRGQLKLFVCALILAQGQHAQQISGKKTVYLIDDFAAELDMSKRVLLARCLQHNGSQVFVSAIEEQMLDGFDLEGCTMFHVEHGVISDYKTRVKHG